MRRQVHPDKNPSTDAPLAFDSLQIAHETLSDTAKRRDYDRRLRVRRDLCRESFPGERAEPESSQVLLVSNPPPSTRNSILPRARSRRVALVRRARIKREVSAVVETAVEYVSYRSKERPRLFFGAMFLAFLLI